MWRTVVVASIVVAVLCGCEGEFPTSASHFRAAKEAVDLEQLQRSLLQIEGWHTDHGTGLADSLQEGVPVPSIEVAFEGEACMPTDELKALWSWRDGEHSAVPFIWYHDFLSMEEAKSEYNKLLLNPLLQWDPYYIPVFAFEGEWYASYCGPESKLAGPVVHMFVEDEPRITYTNITTFLTTMAEILSAGAVSWREGGMVDHIGMVYEIHQKHNRGYPFPYYVPGLVESAGWR